MNKMFRNTQRMLVRGMGRRTDDNSYLNSKINNLKDFSNRHNLQILV